MTTAGELADHLDCIRLIGRFTENSTTQDHCRVGSKNRAVAVRSLTNGTCLLDRQSTGCRYATLPRVDALIDIGSYYVEGEAVAGQ